MVNLTLLVVFVGRTGEECWWLFVFGGRAGVGGREVHLFTLPLKCD